MKQIITFILVICLCMLASTKAQDVSRVGTAAAQFLKVGVGAQACALGETGVTISDDAASLYWNPSGIASIDKTSLSVTRNQLYADLAYTFLGFVQPLGNSSALGVSAYFLDSGDIEITTLASPEGTGSNFSWEAYCIGVSYSRYVTQFLRLGGTAKFIQEGAYHQKARGLAFDLGSLLDTGVLGLKLGMSLSNFGGDMKLSGSSLEVTHIRWPNNPGALTTPAYLKTESWPLPMLFRVGLSTQIIGSESAFLKNESNKLTIAADTYDSSDALMRSNFGIEYEWNNMLALRAGYRGMSLQEDAYNTYDTASFTFGGGLRYDLKITTVQIDYAYTDFQLLGTGQQFSVMLSF